jgi:hypothetical protein
MNTSSDSSCYHYSSVIPYLLNYWGWSISIPHNVSKISKIRPHAHMLTHPPLLTAFGTPNRGGWSITIPPAVWFARSAIPYRF